MNTSSWGNSGEIHDLGRDLVRYWNTPWTRITAKVEMGGDKHAPKCCAILKLQVSHRLWFSLVVCSLNKWKKKYLYTILRLAVSAFKIQGLVYLIIPKRGSSLTLPALMSEVTSLNLEDSLLGYMQERIMIEHKWLLWVSWFRGLCSFVWQCWGACSVCW